VFLGSGIAGIPIFRTLATPSVVWLSLVLGMAMFLLGNSWTNRILRKADPQTSDPGLQLDALGIALQAGLPLSVAAELVDNLEVTEFQNISAGSGVALSQLVSDRADAMRLEQFNQDRLKIQKTSVAVLWPLGLTVLPAFVLIAIVPVGAALIQSR
jgi:tight adherence protein B